MSSDNDMVTIPVDGDPFNALAMIKAICSAVESRGVVSAPLDKAMSSLHEEAHWMAIAAAFEMEFAGHG